MWLRVVRRPANPFSRVTLTSPPVRCDERPNPPVHAQPIHGPAARPRRRADGHHRGQRQVADAEGPHRVQELRQGVLVLRRDHVKHTDPGAAGEQAVGRTHRSPPAARDSTGGVVELGCGPVDRDVRVEGLRAREPVGHGVVDEPAVRVEDDPVDAGGVDPLDRLERQLASKQRLAAGDDRLPYPELERLADDPPPCVVVELGGALEGPARRVRVAEAAAQVAVVGQLELRPVRTLSHRLGRARTPVRVAQPAAGIPPEASCGRFERRVQGAVTRPSACGGSECAGRRILRRLLPSSSISVMAP